MRVFAFQTQLKYFLRGGADILTFSALLHFRAR
jgi:hypothetical protein